MGSLPDRSKRFVWLRDICWDTRTTDRFPRATDIDLLADMASRRLLFCCGIQLAAAVGY
jgi:hypothetical protein